MLPVHYVWELAGTMLPSSFVPVAFGRPRPLNSKMSLRDRFENVLLDLYINYFTKYGYIPHGEDIYRKYLGNDLPAGIDIQKNFSLIFSNSHYAYNAPAPAMPDIIEVGGMHCRPPQPQALSKDLEDFLSGAPDGFVYFSMGSLVKSQYFSEEIRSAFITAFSKLKQRVIWKFETEIDNLPSNIRTSKWLSQQDILGHKNIRLFITHAGAMSIYEAIYHGVPLITLPIFCDQNVNANFAQERGYSLSLEILDFSEPAISAAINELVNNQTYSRKAKEVSETFKDQPQTPLERAIFWTEYVLRHKGAALIRSSARELNFVEYYHLDIIAILALIIVSGFFIIIYLIKTLFSCCTKSVANKDKKSAKVKSN